MQHNQCDLIKDDLNSVILQSEQTNTVENEDQNIPLNKDQNNSKKVTSSTSQFEEQSYSKLNTSSTIHAEPWYKCEQC